MIFANKKRLIEVIQCSGEDMSYVLTNGMPQMSITVPSALSAPAMPPPSPLTLQRPILSPGKDRQNLYLLEFFKNQTSFQVLGMTQKTFRLILICV